MKQYIVINTPPSNRIWKKFKAAFPHAEFYGSSTLGSKRKSYLISADEFDLRKTELKALKVTKARQQPYLK